MRRSVGVAARLPPPSAGVHALCMSACHQWGIAPAPPAPARPPATGGTSSSSSSSSNSSSAISSTSRSSRSSSSSSARCLSSACASTSGRGAAPSSPPPAPPPAPQPLLRVWWARPGNVPWGDGATTAAYESLLPAYELAGLESAATEGMRQERLLARALVRTSLASCLMEGGGDGPGMFAVDGGGGAGAGAGGSSSRHAEAARRLAFERNGSGKPFLAPLAAAWRGGEGGGAGGPALQHNLTHTSGLIGCAVCPPGVPVGLDAELLSRSPRNLLRLARRRLAAQEYDALSVLSDDASRAALFVRLWTLKEAFVKCRGTGINAPPGLRGFAVGLQRPLLLDDGLEALCGLPLGDDAPVEVTLELRGGAALGAALATSLGSAQDAGASASGGDGSAFVPSSRWKFVLFRPSADHVAAACVADPPAWPPVSGSGGGGGGQQGGGVAMWQCVPLHWERPIAPVLLGCSR
ncbi:hypothetical protein FOA52_000421 [Chlamydomonas sp. UWO 241]|nr:hypothetical protein FOA52_000421 [Chlamydomonas sp. UWO 241]